MKKSCTSLLLFCLQTSLILSCDSVIEIPNIHPRIHIDDHMATAAALITASNYEDTRMLHYTAIGILAAKLITEEDECIIFTKTKKEFSPFIFPDARPENTFCMFVSTFLSPDATKVEAQAKTDRALAQTAHIPPIATFTTHTRNHDNHDTIKTTHHESHAKCTMVIPLFHQTYPQVCINTIPQTRERFTYNIKNNNTLISILPPLPSHPGHEVLLLAASQPETDNTTKIVKIWALPHESKKER